MSRRARLRVGFLVCVLTSARRASLISIAHRLNAVTTADQIVVLENGRVTQRGAHAELLAQEGTYRNFISLRREAADWTLAI